MTKFCSSFICDFRCFNLEQHKRVKLGGKWFDKIGIKSKKTGIF